VRVVAALLLFALACGKSNKVDRLEKQVADLEDEVDEARRERRRAERRADKLEYTSERDRLEKKIDAIQDKLATMSPAALEADKTEANRAYDRMDYDKAMALARKVLERVPTDVRMLRLLVSSACMTDDAVVAQRYYGRLPDGGPDREQMKTRCVRRDIQLRD
jgi:outer membrane murein-binding lipoprotein Lpp